MTTLWSSTTLIVVGVGALLAYVAGYQRGYHEGAGYAMCESVKATRAAFHRPWPYPDCATLATQDWATKIREAQQLYPLTPE